MPNVWAAWHRALLSAVCIACGDGTGSDTFRVDADAAAVDGVVNVAIDTDDDGLCDGTEAALGTDPMRADSDGDGLLDGHERIAGTDPRDRLDPRPDQVGHLRAGSTFEFPVPLVVATMASAVRGRFSDRNALDPQSRRAGDFFQSSRAISAEPPDNVRDIEPAFARFDAVRTHTRLLFQLTFSADASVATDCAAVLPFDYVAMTDASELVAHERLILIVSPAQISQGQPHYCLPVACL